MFPQLFTVNAINMSATAKRIYRSRCVLGMVELWNGVIGLWFLSHLKLEALVVIGKSCISTSSFYFSGFWKVGHALLSGIIYGFSGQFAFVAFRNMREGSSNQDSGFLMQQHYQSVYPKGGKRKRRHFGGNPAEVYGDRKSKSAE